MSQHVATWWPNARNMLRPTMLRCIALACCDRLAGALRFKPRPNDRNMRTQRIATMPFGHPLGPLATCMVSQHIATRWPNAHNRLRPTMLRYAALACCDRLAGALPKIHKANVPLKPRPNDRNMPTQHIAAVTNNSSFQNYTHPDDHTIRNIRQHCWAQHVVCVWPPCCDMLGVVGSNLTIFKLLMRIL